LELDNHKVRTQFELTKKSFYVVKLWRNGDIPYIINHEFSVFYKDYVSVGIIIGVIEHFKMGGQKKGVNCVKWKE
jgi:hypothetical protein